MATQKTLITAEDLFRMPSSKRYELVKGELREMTPPGWPHGRIAARFANVLVSYVDKHNLGEVLCETGFRIRRNPDTVRSPDVAFVALERLPADRSSLAYADMAPDLVIDVVSPNDSAAEIQEKVQDWLQAGARMVLVAYPNGPNVVVHQPDGTARTLSSADTLDLAPVRPGFSIPVSALF